MPAGSVSQLEVLVEQPGAHLVGEQVVVAVSLAPVVERDEEQVRPVEQFEGGLAAGRPRHGVAERAAQPIEPW